MRIQIKVQTDKGDIDLTDKDGDVIVCDDNKLPDKIYDAVYKARDVIKEAVNDDQ